MKTTIYWAIQHCCSVVLEFRFRVACWWLSQHVEFLEWRLKLEGMLSPAYTLTDGINPSPVALVPATNPNPFSVQVKSFHPSANTRLSSFRCSAFSSSLTQAPSKALRAS